MLSHDTPTYKRNIYNISYNFIYYTVKTHMTFLTFLTFLPFSSCLWHRKVVNLHYLFCMGILLASHPDFPAPAFRRNADTLTTSLAGGGA